MHQDKDTDTDEDTQLMDKDTDVEVKMTTPYNNSKSPTQLWKLYRNWLRLMVAQFSAVETLGNYVKSPAFGKVFNDISVNVVVLPFVSVTALPLMTLLKQQELFPASTSKSDVTNADLLEFIDLVQPLMGALVELESFVALIVAAKTPMKSLSVVKKATAALDAWPVMFPRLPKWQGHGVELKDYFLKLVDPPIMDPL